MTEKRKAHGAVVQMVLHSESVKNMRFKDVSA
jgi:hypothetical protein